MSEYGQRDINVAQVRLNKHLFEVCDQLADQVIGLHRTCSRLWAAQAITAVLLALSLWVR